MMKGSFIYMHTKNIKAIPNPSRPRERLEKYGVKHLADHELLAIILRTGTQGKNVVSLALEVLNVVEDIYRLKHILWYYLPNQRFHKMLNFVLYN